jgi:hypothetical protein
MLDEANRIEQLKIMLPDWDWGEKSNEKLREMFSIPSDQPMYKNERLEFFLNYLLQEVDVNELVSVYLHHTPVEVLVSQADAIGCYELELEEDDETGTTHSQQDA